MPNSIPALVDAEVVLELEPGFADQGQDLCWSRIPEESLIAAAALVIAEQDTAGITTRKDLLLRAQKHGWSTNCAEFPGDVGC